MDASNLEIGCITVAMTLAQKAHAKQVEYKEVTELVPPQYHAYLDVFQDFPGKKLPPQRDYDHAIDLSEMYKPQRLAPYSLSPAHMLALDEFLDENLAKGFICPSKSPQAAPLFFVPKKNNKQ